MGYFRSIGTDKSIMKVSDLERLMENKQTQLIELNKVKKEVEKKADFRSQALLLMGSSVLIAQFAFITSGTFVHFSWDIMEPIAYIMLFTNFTMGFLFYTLLKKDFELGTIREILNKKFADRMYRKRGFDIESVEKLEAEIVELSHIINRNIF